MKGAVPAKPPGAFAPLPLSGWRWRTGCSQRCWALRRGATALVVAVLVPSVASIL